MSDAKRPDPDELIQQLRATEKASGQGKLRIFLGMAAGVGKTYAMLQAAQQRLTEGVDVVIGVVETHGRAETAALVEGLPQIERKQIEYKTARLQEMDLDAILARQPKLVLVDELAHSNVPGARHAKRYMDVIEILERGIDVYTTINVQHFESRKEAVEAIAQIKIRETVPDSILERAQLTEMVDIAPTELLRRLQEGKVYLGDRAARATAGFFKEDRLTALREIALRLTAERVDQDLRRLAQQQPDAQKWQANERLMVAVSHSPYSEILIRATRRIAYNLESPWVAVHVDTGLRLSVDDQAQLVKNLNLARDLKAEVVSTTDVDIVDSLRRVARQKNVTQIIVGRPVKRRVTDFVNGGTLLDRLVREGGDLDVHVLRTDNESRPRSGRSDTRRLANGIGSFLQYWYCFWAITILAVLSALLEPLVGYRAVGFVFLLGVLGVGMIWPLGVVIFAASLSALIWNFFFIPPKLTFAVSEPADVMMCLLYFAVALIVGLLTNRVRSHERLIREREERTNTLYEILQVIASSKDKQEFLTKVNERLGQMLDGKVGVLLRGLDGKLQIDQSNLYSLPLDANEMAVVQWAFASGKTAGWSTNTLSEAKGLYIPLQSSAGAVGILVYKPNTLRKLSLEQENILYSISRQLAISLEKHFNEKRLRHAEKLEESEHLHQTLLSSISHELRTPLTVILGNASALSESATDKNTQLLANSLVMAGDRLNRVIENLLDMSRLNSGMLTLKKDWHYLNDLVEVVLKKTALHLQGRDVTVSIAPDFALVEMDFRLVEHALSNLLINASMYTPAGTAIAIAASCNERWISLAVTDQGPGIPESAQSQIFAKFFRLPGSRPGGMGLGLSIAKGILEAHKGNVRVENPKAGGACFVLELPVAKLPGPLE